MQEEFFFISSSSVSLCCKSLTEIEIENISTLERNLTNMGHSLLYSQKFVKSLPTMTFDRSYRKVLTVTKRSQLIKSVLYALVVRQVILNEETAVPSEEELRSLVHIDLFGNPALTTRDAVEIEHLCGFLRAIRTLQDIGIPGHNNKQVYLQVGAMLEGSKKHYATGGAPSKATLRREVVFEAVTGCGRRAPRNVKERSPLDDSMLLDLDDLTSLDDSSSESQWSPRVDDEC